MVLLLCKVPHGPEPKYMSDLLVRYEACSLSSRLYQGYSVWIKTKQDEAAFSVVAPHLRNNLPHLKQDGLLWNGADMKK